LPFCTPPPCTCRKCQRKHKHDHCGNYGPGYGCNYGPGCGGNPYLDWPCPMGGCSSCYGPAPYPCSYQGCGQGRCSHKSRHKHGCSYDGQMYSGCGYPYGGGYGCGYGDGCGTMGCGGFMDSGCGGCTPYIAPPPPPCSCRKCQKKHGGGHHGGGYPGCGYPGWGSPYGGGCGDGWGTMGCGGFTDGCFGDSYAPCASPPPLCSCHKCQRKHGHGYAGCGYPGWPAYPVPGANQWDCGCDHCGKQRCCGGCGKHHGCWSHHGHFCRKPAPYPYWAYPQPMPCMMGESFCGDCGFDGGFCSAPIGGGTCK
jgi:hypothetical protein